MLRFENNKLKWNTGEKYFSLLLWRLQFVEAQNGFSNCAASFNIAFQNNQIPFDVKIVAVLYFSEKFVYEANKISAPFLKES